MFSPEMLQEYPVSQLEPNKMKVNWIEILLFPIEITGDLFIYIPIKNIYFSTVTSCKYLQCTNSANIVLF